MNLNRRRENKIDMEAFAQLLKKYDYGPIKSWDPSLTDAVNFCLESLDPVVIHVGKKDYADVDDFPGCIKGLPAIGNKHKQSGLAFGNMNKILHAEWEKLTPQIRTERYYTYLMSPIHIRQKIIGAIVCCKDTTDKVLGIERIRLVIRIDEFIKELTAENPKITEIREEDNENSGTLPHLCSKITKDKGAIKDYYLFGESLSQLFDYYYAEFSNKQQAQMAVNEELKKQLPNITTDARNKKKERAQKIYSFFNDIGFEKIELVKSFSADFISKLNIEQIEYVKDIVMKTAPQTQSIETSLNSHDANDEEFVRQLENLDAITSNYATESIETSFNWDEIAAGKNNVEGEWYLIAFRSIGSKDANIKKLVEAEAEAYNEAKNHGGLLKYWSSEFNQNRECLSLCIWRSIDEAVKASKKPCHAFTVGLASANYETYKLEKYKLKKTKGEIKINITELKDKILLSQIT
ncbi:25628_t:CDS:2 [Dentiscutata erythropus]|uniref:25628_t:CDS:1 n=1 Tax=Dentiscutata erythropus TaxID=1348616 RepID=A0A9N8W888_9GLOM|nr:25628_t:CDS:2 [Dentiscutata erythropus]